MDDRSAALLELPAVLERLAGHTSFPGGHQAALHLRPAADPDRVAALQDETTEALALWGLGLSAPGGAHDITAAVRAAQHGTALDLGELEDVLTTALIALETRDAVLQHREDAPRLAAHADGIDALSLREIVAPFGRALDRRGGVMDGASDELARVRRELASARARASSLLRELAGSLKAHLQEGFVTERGGRPVLAVKASSRSAVPGLVHDTSGSGGTLFVEPLALVEANNAARELEAAERDEVARVLAALSARAGERADALCGAVEGLSTIDLAIARAALSREWNGCVVEGGDEIVIEGARHPLLDPATAVPVDIPLGELRAVVVSGPNTGGKTVSLKTLGLLALLHQCGLRVPARRARLPVFDDVLADIGDEQSIAQSLSTFSGHVRRIGAILDAAGPRSLVVLDEIAGGTDPVEGAALAVAVVEALVDAGARVMVTSHLADVRDWAGGAEGAANAAVGFDSTRLSPTYELRMGELGASHALSIAERLGLPGAVLDAARGRMAPERLAVEELLLEADAARAAAQAERARVEEERAALEEARRRAERREKDLSERIEKSRERAEKERAAARREAEAELADATAELRALRAEIRAARRAEASRTTAPANQGSVRDRHLGAADAVEARAREALARLTVRAPSRPVTVGERATDTVLGLSGTVLAIEGDQADLQGPMARVRVPLARLVADERAPASPARAEPVRVEVALPVDAGDPEIDVRGQRADEARAAVRARVDAASMAGRRTLRVIHGKGTGALRKAVREELSRHPLVVRAEPAALNEGGEGATLVQLADDPG